MNLDAFEHYPVPRAVASFAIPSVLTSLVTVFYNMADTFFVGQTGDPNQVAAVSLATPVFLLLLACGNIFGIGGGSCLSRALGEGKYEGKVTANLVTVKANITKADLSEKRGIMSLNPQEERTFCWSAEITE